MYKKITKTGEKFIRTICSGDENPLIEGGYKYNLPFSSTEINSFTTNYTTENGYNISTNSDLGEELILLFNKYGELAEIDANLLAAQSYIESKYNTWHYNKFNTGSGIVNITGTKVYSHIINYLKPKTVEGLNNLPFSDEEINRIINGLTNPYDEYSYKPKAYGTTEASKTIAKNNRIILHQNIIDNIDIQIKFLASIMREILDRNNHLVSNALLAYKTYWLISEKSYVEALNFVSNKIDSGVLERGIKYVNQVFYCLGDSDNIEKSGKPIKPEGISFGYDITFNGDKFNAYLK